MIMRKAVAGFAGFGEVNSPKEIIERKCIEIKSKLEEELEIIYTGPISDDREGKDVRSATEQLKHKEFDVLILCIAGWIPSHAVISVAREFIHIPMVLLGLSGYYESGKLITTADQAGTTALRSVMEDMGYDFKYIFNIAGTDHKTQEVINYAKAARARKLLNTARIGMMGYRDMNLYGTMFDGISLRRKIGVEVEVFEMLEMLQKAELADDTQVSNTAAELTKDWDFARPAKQSTLEEGTRYYLALKELIIERDYEAISLIDVDGMKKLLKYPPSMVFMLIADNLNICTIPENDTLGSVTQLIVKYLTGQAAAYLEFYEFMEDRVLAGVPDYVPKEITDGKTTVCPATFGNFSEGVLNVSVIKTGRITLSRLHCADGKYSMHIVTGNAVTPRPWEEAGWTPPAPQLPGLEIILDKPVEEFACKVISQHYIISYGDNTELLRDFCTIMGIDII